MAVDLRKHMNLLVGFFVASAGIIVITALALLLSIQGLFHPEYELFAVFNDGVGLRKGTAVLFKGVKVGSVEEINLLQGDLSGPGSATALDVYSEPSGSGHMSPTVAFVVLRMNIDLEYKNFINDSTMAIVMRDKNLVSDRVINLTPKEWTPDWAPETLESGDTLRGTTTMDIETVLSGVNYLMGKVDGMLARVDDILSQVSDSSTTIGALLGSKELYERLQAEFDQLMTATNKGNDILNTVQRVGGKVEEALPKILSNADTAVAGLARTSGNLETVVSRLDGILGQTEALVGKTRTFIDEGSGTLQEADALMKAVSEFWFIRGKIKKQQVSEFPLLYNGIGH